MCRINKILVHVFLVFIFIFISSVSAFAELKIGYIRPNYIFNNYEPYKEAQKRIQEFQKSEMKKIEDEGKKFQENYETFKKQEILMSEEMLSQKQQELMKQKEALDKSYDDLINPDGGRLSKKQEELIAPIIDKINEVLTRIGKEDNYDFIIDAEQGLLYADEKHEISDMILEELKKGISTK